MGVKMIDEKLEGRSRIYESPGNNLTRNLVKIVNDKGFLLASCTGMRMGDTDMYYDMNVIGILSPRPDERGFLGLRRKQRASYLGNLWLSNEARNAEITRKWVLEVYGRNNLPLLTDLVRQMSEPYKVEVEVRLISEGSRLEEYASDFQG
jgi:hypothetical protein